ncbi:MAG: hypothetical protein ABSG57_07670 [Candidatus Bathyarchaeia archaeon]
MQSNRTSFPEAVKTVLDTMEKKRTLSVNALSHETGLNRRTVEKTLRLLLDVQPYFLHRSLRLVEMNHSKLIEINEKSGLLDLPENIQNLIIRTVYYPNPSKEETILTHILLKEAFSPEKAISLEKDATVRKLVKQGQVLEERALFYLSDEGKIVAEGALKLYPELKELAYA